MRVAILADTPWLMEDLASFERLVIGLIDQQAQVTQVIPEEWLTQGSSILGPRIGWAESDWRLVRRYRLASLHEQLAEANIQIVHAVSWRLWDGALALAEKLNVPVVLGVSSREDLELVPHLARKWPRRRPDGFPIVPGSESGPIRPAFIANTQPLWLALREMLGEPTIIDYATKNTDTNRANEVWNVELIRPGVLPNGPGARAATAPTDRLSMRLTDNTPGERVPCIAVSGDGRMDEDTEALLAAMVDVVQEFPQTQFFFDGLGPDQQEFWLAARQAALLANLSMLPRPVGQRDLLLRADLLLEPQALGVCSALTLQAMAVGMPVIARLDPALDYLVDEQTAWLVESADAARWKSLILRAINKPAEAAELGARARAWVMPRYSVAQQAVQTAELYRRLVGEPLAFPKQ